MATMELQLLENTADEVKFKNITGSTGDTGTLTTDRFTGCNQTHAFGTLSRQCLTVFGFDFSEIPAEKPSCDIVQNCYYEIDV